MVEPIQGAWWDSWNRFDSSGMRYTQDLLDALGIDRFQVTDDDQMSEALHAACEHNDYQVRTESKRGSRQGDRWFTSTYVEARPAPAKH